MTAAGVACRILRPEISLRFEDLYHKACLVWKFPNEITTQQFLGDNIRGSAEEPKRQGAKTAHGRDRTILLPMAETVLVTGGAGFIGSHIAESLLASGRRVVIVDNLSTGRRENVPEGSVWMEADIRTVAWDPIFERFSIDWISHHAAQANVRRSVADPASDAEVNVLGTLRLIAAARRFGIRRFLFASSGGTVYGEQECFPCDETHPTRPISPYGCAKLAAELYLEAYRQSGDLEPIILRYANVYGPRQDPKGDSGIVAILFEHLLEGRRPRIFGDGLQTRDYVYVSDVVAVHDAAATRWIPGTYNVGTGLETSVLELLDKVASLLEVQVDPLFEAPYTSELRRNVLDSSKLEKTWGLHPKVSLEEGLSQTLRWHLKDHPLVRSAQ